MSQLYVRLGFLEVGDQLPTVRQAVAQLAVNPNTMLKAYRELEHAVLVAGRPGQGIFVQRTLVGPGVANHAALGRGLERRLTATMALELGAADHGHLADIFLRDLEARYRLIPLPENAPRRGAFDGYRTALPENAVRHWQVLAVAFGALIVLPLTLFELVPLFLSSIITRTYPLCFCSSC